MARKPRSSSSDKARGTFRPDDSDSARPEETARPEDTAPTSPDAESPDDTGNAAGAPEAADTGTDAPNASTEDAVPEDAGLKDTDLQPEPDSGTGPSGEPAGDAPSAEGPEETQWNAPDTDADAIDANARATDADEQADAATADNLEPAQDTPQAAQTPPDHSRAARGPGFLTLLVGGVLAAVIGFGAARFVIPEGWPFGPVSQATRELTQALDQQGERLDSLRADLDTLPDTLTDDIEQSATEAADTATAALRDDMGARIDALATDVTAVQDSLGRLDDFDARLTELERRPVADGAASRAAIASFERELADLRDLLEQERTRNAKAEAEIEQRAQALREESAQLAREAAMDRAREQLSRALASGGGFAGALDALEEAGVTIPDALRQHAQTGVATQESLQNGFAEPARAALQATADSATGEIGAFLRTQFGVRSLTPREGDSVDAILSRAEAAVQAGDLAGALNELDALPPEGQAAMSEWIEAAQARKDVVAAAASVTQ